MEAAGIPFVGVQSGKLRRAASVRGLLTIKNLTDALRVPVGIGQAIGEVRRFWPDAVLATGGYVSVPTVVAAGLLGRPVLIHEQTVQIGLANKIAARFASRIALTFEGAAAELPPNERRKTFVTGNPVREEIFGGSRERAVERFGFDPAENALPTVYVTGGALGAKSINAALEAALPELLSGCRVVHQCGRAEGEHFQSVRAALPDSLRGRYWAAPFVGEEIADIFALCDLVAGRSGAGTVTEAAALGKPALFIPLVPTGGDEQTRNAKRSADAGAAAYFAECGADRAAPFVCAPSPADGPGAAGGDGAGGAGAGDAERGAGFGGRAAVFDRLLWYTEYCCTLTYKSRGYGTLTVSECIHFVGIGGAGMSGLARVLARQGVAVTGSDLRESPTLAALRREAGIRAEAGHQASNLNGATLVVASAAVKRDNPEMAAARERGIPIISRAEMLGRLMARYPRSVAVTGTHGKTTTTGMTALVLEAGHLDPTVLIGGDLPAYGGNARLGSSDVFLAEACEAYDSFLDLAPQIAVVLNMEADHLDYYGDLANVLRSFRRFLSQVSGTAIVHGADANIQAVLADKSGHLPEIITYAVDNGGSSAALTARDLDLGSAAPSYTAAWHGKPLGRVQIGVPGLHNVANSLAAVGVGLTLGVSFEQIAAGLAAFTGTGRRFERLGATAAGVLVIDDYAHHPTEIKATIAAARRAYAGRRIVAVFQPHLPSRTRDFKTEFAESFADADHVVLTDIFLAREQPLDGVTGAGLAALTADRRGADHVTYVADKSALPARLSEIVQSGDLVLTLGAGDIRSAGEGLLSCSLPSTAGL